MTICIRLIALACRVLSPLWGDKLAPCPSASIDFRVCQNHSALPSRKMAPVTITYTSHPAPSQPINQAIKSLRDQLPLRNLHWKPSTRTSLRTIQEIDVELVELGDVPTRGRSGLSSVLEQPLVNLCMVVCEVSAGYQSRGLRAGLRDIQEFHEIVYPRLAVFTLVS
jgi:hypothetical protein